MMNNPGCFGSVIYHDTTSRRCEVCPVQTSCANLVEENKKELNSWYNALASGKKVTSSPKAVEVMSGLSLTKPPREKNKAVTVSGVSSSTLNKKPREFVEKWINKGVKFDAYKTTSNNPFEVSGNKFAVVAMDFFLQNPSGVTKTELTQELVKKCGTKGQGWGLGTAASHAGIVIEAFEYLGIIYKNEGKIYLR